MPSRSLLAAVFLPASALAGQSGRTMTLTAPPRLGTTMVITVQHPAGAQGNYYEALASLPTAAVVNLGIGSLVGELRIDLNTFQPFSSGALGSNGSTTINVPIPNLPSLVGAGFDLQTIDVRLADPEGAPVAIIATNPKAASIASASNPTPNR